ncbi:RNA polymerase sigma factor [Maricaulis sp.]|uniref:RNA polymerase sigma factor n=1 Tax=Maricaulis sp. TaxID=1486257 RepID=UPI001B16213D|nr:RNA polymerase sigma factor [Maricaulis sp.]MBO6798382.1 RNA polymerase sigma factor [Maricaulis sp.]
MNQAQTDADLVSASLAGSDAAFSRLVDRHQQALRSFLRRVSGNEADADELAQEVFLAAWTKLKLLRSPDKFRSWLFGMAWSMNKTFRRSAARRRARDEAWQDLQPQTATPQDELRLALNKAMAELGEDQRAVVALCLAGGWTHDEASGALDIPLGTVKSHVSRGRARLEQILGDGHER